VTRDELKAALAKWIADITEEPPPQLEESTDLAKDVGLDSLALAELAARVRRELKVKLKPGEMAKDLKVSSLLDAVTKLMAAGPK
jgi:acyl carrier protein